MILCQLHGAAGFRLAGALAVATPVVTLATQCAERASLDSVDPDLT